MKNINQQILPSIKNLQKLDAILTSSYEWFVLLEVHLSNLIPVLREAKKHEKKVIIHADLIQGLKTDDFAAEFLLHTVRPDGIISTRTNMLQKAKEKNILTVQRIFLLDSIALEKSYTHVRQTKPDYIEVLPGIIPEYIGEIKSKTNTPVICGGLIDTFDHIQNAIDAGATAITTTDESLWKEASQQNIG